MKRRLATFIVLVVALCAASVDAQRLRLPRFRPSAATQLFTGTSRNASTCSRTDVNTQIAASSPGDIVNVPAGASCDWSAGLTVSGIALRCAGSSTSGTVVTGGLVTVTKHASSYTQVSNCRFAGEDQHFAVGGSTTAKPFIIDHNYVDANAVPWSRQTTNGGLWWANEFVAASDAGPSDGFSNNLGVSAASSEWDAATTMGSDDTTGEVNTYFEDNSWTYLLEVAFDCDEGARIVARHNTLTDSSIVAHAGGSGSSGNDTSTHGCRHLEIYDNTFDRVDNNVAINKWIWMRGTTGVFIDNALDDASSSNGNYPNKYEIHLRVGCTLGGYPRRYQVGQSTKTETTPPAKPYLIYGNTGAGVNSAQWIQISENNSGASYTECSNPTDYIQVGRDYETSNTWSYSKYTYPHPLRAGL
jgi:hypothetical protein